MLHNNIAVESPSIEVCGYRDTQAQCEYVQVIGNAAANATPLLQEVFCLKSLEHSDYSQRVGANFLLNLSPGILSALLPKTIHVGGVAMTGLFQSAIDFKTRLRNVSSSTLDVFSDYN